MLQAASQVPRSYSISGQENWPILPRNPGKIGQFSCPLIEYDRGTCDAAWSIRMMSPAKALIPVTALALVAQLTVAFADGVPRYNLEPLCRGIAQQGGMSLLPNQSPKKD